RRAGATAPGAIAAPRRKATRPRHKARTAATNRSAGRTAPAARNRALAGEAGRPARDARYRERWFRSSRDALASSPAPRKQEPGAIGRQRLSGPVALRFRRAGERVRARPCPPPPPGL